ncbi:hypothetical protein [Pelagibius sp.]|uniref:hypothetical protein n=1 Tax=Pelagibius sp. TaxID=1931238 RepID=UPI002632DC74|nr:hypothetical protein [Pelagibius sp.]
MVDGQTSPRDGWSKAQSVATIFATVAVPIIVAFAGYVVNANLKDRDVKLRTTELAIAILREDPKNSPETPQLRQWAAEVIDQYSGVSFPEGALDELRENAIPISYANGFFGVDPTLEIKAAQANLRALGYTGDVSCKALMRPAFGELENLAKRFVEDNPPRRNLVEGDVLNAMNRIASNCARLHFLDVMGGVAQPPELQ